MGAREGEHSHKAESRPYITDKHILEGTTLWSSQVPKHVLKRAVRQPHSTVARTHQVSTIQCLKQAYVHGAADCLFT